MRAGSLRHPITLQNPTSSPDGDGGYTETWTDFDPAQVFASIVPASAQRLERVFGGAVEAVATHLVTVRYHPKLSTQSRVRFGSRLLRICSIVNVEERNVEMQLACQEIL